MAKDNDRFETVYRQGSLNEETRILRDRETGVNYLWRQQGYGGGFTPLLNAVGGVVITGTPERR